MTEKTESLRLADAQDCVTDDNCGYCVPCSVAAELRRLHEAHDWQYKMAGERLRRIEKLEAQRGALLEALKEIYDWTAHKNTVWATKARAAIKAVEGENP